MLSSPEGLPGPPSFSARPWTRRHTHNELLYRHAMMLFLRSPSQPILCSRACPSELPGQLPREDIEQLIRRLGSDNYKEREAATQELLKREEAAPALRSAARSPTRKWPAGRHSRSWRRFTANGEHLGYCARLRAFAEDGAVDRFAELLAKETDGIEESKLWEEVTRLSSKLLIYTRNKRARRTSPGS